MICPFFSGALVALLTISLAPSSFAATPDNPTYAPHSTKVFSQLDTNRDGLLTQQELTDGGKLRFTKADSDKGGFLSQTELVTQRLEKMRHHAARKSAEVLERIDTNKDGRLGLTKCRLPPATEWPKSLRVWTKTMKGFCRPKNLQTSSYGQKKRWARSEPKTN